MKFNWLTNFLTPFGFTRDYFADDDGKFIWNRYGEKWIFTFELAWPRIWLWRHPKNYKVSDEASNLNQ